MKARILTITLVVLTMALGACSSMGPEECAATDWSAIGYEDGSRGMPTEYFGNHRKACAKHGITADFAAYKAGRNEGLVEFCQPSRGYNLGVSGGRYHGVCDIALEEEFLDAYQVGHQLYSLRASVNNATSQIAARESELERVRDSIRAKEALLISSEPTPQERVLLLADIKELAERTGELETEIAVLIEERAHHQSELTNYQNTVAAYGF